MGILIYIHHNRYYYNEYNTKYVLAAAVLIGALSLECIAVPSIIGIAAYAQQQQQSQTKSIPGHFVAIDYELVLPFGEKQTIEALCEMHWHVPSHYLQLAYG